MKEPSYLVSDDGVFVQVVTFYMFGWLPRTYFLLHLPAPFSGVRNSSKRT
jgi:hypothetical protein